MGAVQIARGAADLMARHDLLETALAGHSGDRQLMSCVDPSMHQTDRDGLDTGGLPVKQTSPNAGQIQRLQQLAAGGYPPRHFGNRRIQRGRSLLVKPEQLSSALIVDQQQVGKTGAEQHADPRAATFKQCIGRHRGTQAHAVDRRLAKAALRRPVQQPAHAFQYRILILPGRLAQQLDASDLTIRRGGQHVGEGAAAINRKAPAGLLHSRARQEAMSEDQFNTKDTKDTKDTKEEP